MPSWQFGMNGSDYMREKTSGHGRISSQLFFEHVEAFDLWNEGSQGVGGVTAPLYHDAAEICGGAGDTRSLLI